MKMKEEQFRLIQAQIKRLMGQGGFYSKKFAGIDPDSIQSQEDFEKLPFTWKGDLPIHWGCRPYRMNRWFGSILLPVLPVRRLSFPIQKKTSAIGRLCLNAAMRWRALPRATASILRPVMDCGQPVLGFKPARSCWGRWRFRWGRAILKNSFV